MKRYESSYEYHPADYGYPSGKMELSYNGDYVLYDDYAKEVGQKDAEIAALKAKYRDLENDYVATESIYEAICDMVTTGKEPSDFMMSFPSVREMWDAINSKDAEIAKLKERVKELEHIHSQHKINTAEMASTNQDLYDKIKDLEAENRRLQSELNKWARPYDNADLQVMKEQSDSKSLAAQQAYINALDWHYRHEQAENNWLKEALEQLADDKGSAYWTSEEVRKIAREALEAK